MSFTKGTSAVKILNVVNIEITFINSIGGTEVQNTEGDQLEQGVSLTTAQDGSVVVGNGCSVSISEKVLFSWVELASLDEMAIKYASFLTAKSFSKIEFTLDNNQFFTVLNPILQMTRKVKSGDLIKYNYNVEITGGDIDDIVLYAATP